jgi:hypothetical protein
MRARQYRDLTDKYTKDVKGFLDMGQTQWMEKAGLHEKAKQSESSTRAPHVVARW